MTRSHLEGLGAIDHAQALHPLPVSTGLDQQGHGQDDVGRAGGQKALTLAFLTDHRVEDAFQALARVLALKGQRTHGRAIQGAFPGQHAIPESGAYRCHGSATGAGERMGDPVGIDNGGPDSPKISAAALLPLPMPPVRPTTKA
jgi:hypothetical protein